MTGSLRYVDFKGLHGHGAFSCTSSLIPFCTQQRNLLCAVFAGAHDVQLHAVLSACDTTKTDTGKNSGPTHKELLDAWVRYPCTPDII
jgi:hypothetical protein